MRIQNIIRERNFYLHTLHKRHESQYDTLPTIDYI